MCCLLWILPENRRWQVRVSDKRSIVPIKKDGGLPQIGNIRIDTQYQVRKQCEEYNQRQHENITDTDVLADRSGNTLDFAPIRLLTREPQVAANAMVTINGMPIRYG